MSFLIKNWSKFRDVQCLCQTVMVPTCDCQAVVSRRHKMTFMLLKTISFLIFFFLAIERILFIFNSNFWTKCAPPYQGVHSTSILSQRFMFLCFQLVYTDAAEKRLTGISRILFQVSAPEGSVLHWKA